METATRFNRIDFYAAPDLAKPEETQEGFLRVQGRISRVGIQVYYDAQGNEHKELRPVDEVFDPESVASFRMLPLTNNHPAMLLDSASARAHAIGALGELIEQDGDFLRSSILIYDRDAISAARGGRSQLSCGYSCELDMTPGVWNGQKYDAVQRRIRGNHCALVDMARAGPEARIRLDAAKNAMIACDSKLETNSESTMPQAIRIDGASFDLTESNASAIQQALDRTVSAAKKDATEAIASEKTRADKAEGKLKIVKANVIAWKKRADAMKAKMVGCDACSGSGKVMDDDGQESKCDYCDGKGAFRMHDAIVAGGDDPDGDADQDDAMEPEQLDANELEVEQETENEAKAAHKDGKRKDAHVTRQRAIRKKIDAMVARRVDARAKLLDVAKRALGPDWKSDGKSSLEIKRAIVGKIEPKAGADKLDGMILEGEFRAAVRKLDDAPSAADIVRGRTTAPALPAAAPRNDSASARQKMVQANQDAWKRPAPAAK